MQSMTFTKACVTFFGRDRGEVKQTLQEFSAELKALNDKDRDDLKAMFPSVGIEIIA